MCFLLLVSFKSHDIYFCESLQERLKNDGERHRQERSLLASVLFEQGMASITKSFQEQSAPAREVRNKKRRDQCIIVGLNTCAFTGISAASL